MLEFLPRISAPLKPYLFAYGSEIATIYASLGDRDQAMNWLEKAYEERFKPGSCCGRASILCARIRGSKTLFTASASLVEPAACSFSNLEAWRVVTSFCVDAQRWKSLGGAQLYLDLAPPCVM